MPFINGGHVRYVLCSFAVYDKMQVHSFCFGVKSPRGGGENARIVRCCLLQGFVINQHGLIVMMFMIEFYYINIIIFIRALFKCHNMKFSHFV